MASRLPTPPLIWSLVDKIICDLNKTPDLSQRPPQNCPKILQDASEPSNDDTNVVNALQEPFVVKQVPGKNSSQILPQINHNCCYGCGDSLEDIFCHYCTCKLCGKGAHYGYNCPPKVPIILDPQPFNNQTVNKLPQTLPSFDPTCYSEDENSFTYNSKSNIVHDSPNVVNPPPQPPLYSCEFCGNDAHEFIKSSVENLVPNPSESEGEYECDVPACENFTTFSNILFDTDYDFSSSDDQLFSDEDIPKFKSFSPFHIPVEDSNSLIEEIDLSFTPDDPMPPDIEEDDYDSERDILILEELLSSDSLSLLENESFQFDIPSSSRPLAKPLDGNLGI
nr:hypothetical protein [Tanacetum cinerariifolium]